MAHRTQRKRQQELVGLFGVGLDNDDEHKRLTTGEDFILVGGSEDTHDRMIDTAVFVHESLVKKGKTLQDATPEELADLILEATIKRR